ncbi:MAG: 50S ribosomal protein L25 [Patescibacteria group bacterium]
MFVIQAKKRDEKVGLNTLRKGGELPAVFYGAGKKSTSVTISSKEFRKIWREAGESSAVVVKTPEGDVDVLIHDVQMDPVRDEPIHVDFLAIDMKKKIKVKVALEFTGVSEAVKSGVGTLVKVLHEIEIEALPKDLPHNLEVDISKLATLQDNITVADIKLPAGVEAITAVTDIVASVVEQVEEKVEEAAPVDLSAIEVTDKKGKKEEEGAEGTEAPAAAAPEKAEKK